MVHSESEVRPPARPTSQATPPSRPPGRWIVTREQQSGQIPPQVDNLGEAERNEIYEAAKRTDYDLPRLQQLSMPQLLELARTEGVEGYPGLNRQELIFQVLRRRVTSTGLGWGEGVLDVLPDGFGFLRSKRFSYLAGPDDVYVSPSQVRRLNLKTGHQLAGPVRPPKEGEKYFALLHVEAVNGGSIEDLKRRIPFDDMTPVLPHERLRLEHPGCGIDLRLFDLLVPLGRGQRVLVSTPPLSGRNVVLKHLAQGILANHPECYVILLLVDERPEEVTEVLRGTGPDSRREVVASTFDEPAARHVALAEIVLERARRMVEAGEHVVLLMDSLTQLVRAYNTEVPHSGKILGGGLDAVALQKPKRLFASARAMEEGGSLTVIATMLTETGSRMNEVIAEEFQGKANCEIVFDPQLTELHVYPALDVAATGTRREDNLLPAEELERIRRLRRHLVDLDRRQALERVIEQLAKTRDNAELIHGL